MKKKRKCPFCGYVFKQGEYGNNPEPLLKYSYNTLCCNKCNFEKVIPARMEELNGTVRTSEES